MRGTLLIVLAILVIGVIIVLFDANVKNEGELPEVDVVEEGALPDVDVNVEGGALPEVEATGGEMPDIDVTAPDIDVQTETREIEVPTDIEVNTPEDTQ